MTAGFAFSPSARAAADAILAGGPAEVFGALMRDQESEAGLLVSRRVVHAFLPEPGADADLDTLVALVASAKTEIDGLLAGLDGVAPREHAGLDGAAPREHAGLDGAAPREHAGLDGVALRERAVLGQLSGCWLDIVSGPSTQPGITVNHLLRHHFALLGEGDPQRSVHQARRRALAEAGVFLPEIGADGFLTAARARPLTAWHATFYLALSRLAPAFLPEVVGVHYAFHALAIDDRLTGLPAALPEPALRDCLAEYLSLTDDPADRARLRAALERTVDLELEHARTLAALTAWHAGLDPHSRAAAVIARHAPFAGSHHGGVTVRGTRLTDSLADLDVAHFLDELRRSRQVKPLPSGGCRLLDALRFGGPMFGIFDDDEAATLADWVALAQTGDRSPITIDVNQVGDPDAARWAAAVAAAVPPDVTFADPEPADERHTLHRLVNITHFPNQLPLAKQRAIRTFLDAEILFEHGARGRYTDASWLDYTPEAFTARVDQIYWEKLVDPVRPLTEIPDREEVRFGQADLAIGNMVDGTWAHRIGNTGRYRRRSDGLLFAIYLDEMGRGDVAKNHLTLIYQVLASMDFTVPHISDPAFLDQDQLSESHRQYESANHQLSMALFPDTFYSEILGYNLGIEMYGLGAMRLTEIARLRAHGFDTAYEDAHLTIDNFSAGHSRQAVDAITAYLDDVRTGLGAAAVDGEWRRIWRGYASFAYFAEPQLHAELAAAEPDSELVI